LSLNLKNATIQHIGAVVRKKGISMPLVILPPTKPQTANDDVTIAGLLTTFYQASSLGKYGPLFFLHNLNINEFKRYAGLAEGSTPTDKPYAVDKFVKYSPAVTFNIQSISALQTIYPFIGVGEPFHVFAYVDGTTLVPYQTAQLLSASFLKGLVTRLILEKYKSIWTGPPFNLSIDFTLNPAGPPPTATPIPAPISSGTPAPPGPPPTSTPPPPMTAQAWVAAYLINLNHVITAPSTWSGLGSVDYPTALASLTDATTQAAGMINGWSAGDALVSVAGDYATCAPVIWKWLNSRYTTKQLGMMVGYTFCYLAGFLRCERTAGFITGAANPPARLNGQSNLSNIYTNLTGSDHAASAQLSFRKDPVFDLANKFFELVNGEFYGIAQQAGYLNQLTALANYRDFIVGFEKGLTQGADVMFAELFDEAYNLGYAYGYNAGYSSGFRDGYSQGYSAGWQEGYSSGYSAGQQNWMSGLGNIFNSLGNLVGDAGTVGKILGDANTVGEVLGAIF
jgi:hypothetical protein